MELDTMQSELNRLNQELREIMAEINDPDFPYLENNEQSLLEEQRERLVADIRGLERRIVANSVSV